MSTIALFGATGTIGGCILHEALSRGHHVTAVLRKPENFTGTHEHLTVRAGDVLDATSVTAAAKGADAVVSAVGGGSGNGPGHIATIRPAAESLVAGLRSMGRGAPRLITVGGAGSLRTPDGLVQEAPGVPEFLLQIMHAHSDALDFLRTVDDVNWTNISPAAQIAPGARTGTYRTALDDLVADAAGTSRISAEDYAVAVIDEIEHPEHVGRRFAVGY